MAEIVIAIFAICIGALFCFSGYAAMRILFPLWGLVAGYWLGAELIHSITGDSFLSTTLAILTGIGFALLGAIFAYFYYAVSVVLFMGMVGYWLGAAFFTLFGWDLDVLSVLLGLAVGALFIAAAMIGNAPKVYLLFITSFAGATLAVSGALLLIPNALIAQNLTLEQFQDGPFAVAFSFGLFWKLVVLVLGVIGWSAQIVSTQKAELAWQAEWEKATAGAK